MILRLQVLILLGAWAGFAAAPDAQDIVRRSVVNNDKNWNVAPQYSFTEKDVITRSGKTTRRTYRVLMIDGSQYNQLIAENGEPLTGARAAAEQTKLQQEIARRHHESPAQRSRRVAEYQRERRQDHALMQEMVKGFNFRLAGQETVNGHECYVLRRLLAPAISRPAAIRRCSRACAARCGSTPGNTSG